MDYRSSTARTARQARRNLALVYAHRHAPYRSQLPRPKPGYPPGQEPPPPPAAAVPTTSTTVTPPTLPQLFT